MNILLIGSGGREHALAWKIKQSDKCDTLYCAPGNAGIGKIATNTDLDVNDHDAVIAFCAKHKVEFVIVGPEVPLVNGLVDSLNKAEILAFGPTAAAAQLEGSKGFTKDICAEFDIPTAAYGRFNNAPKAKAYVREMGAPIVIKADGLAAGKGVVVAMELAEALDAVDACFEGDFGEAGAEVVVEEFLIGEEASLFAVCDGQTAMLMGTAQDHKRVGEGDTGPNTGGMGAYSPAPILDQEMIDEVMSDIIVPTMAAMHYKGMPFKGVLYAGLILTEDGPQLIEYNVRFGDPECQVLMPRLKSDIVEILMASATGDLLETEAEWSDEFALTVVMASKGYPGSYDKNTVIEGTDRAEAAGGLVFHAGTAIKDDQLVATGGRVLNVTGFGKSVSEAQKSAYNAVAQIEWENGFTRSDIGWRAIERENEK
ncbi:MAG: phosphoribosylamine--glycine ligase [Nitratireductor sp.]